jgi:hypothetical protein
MTTAVLAPPAPAPDRPPMAARRPVAPSSAGPGASFDASGVSNS